MPRKARLDAAGALHHVIARGIEQRTIFVDNVDRERFLERLGLLSEETCTPIYAFAIIPNHFHILLRSGLTGLSAFMRRLLTGYATNFNRRHRRAGHLFQNRYRSIVCEEDSYFMELVRYIHLNPFRAGIANTLKELDLFRWSGHRYLTQKNPFLWYDVDSVLQWFGASKNAYRNFIKEGIEKKHFPDLSGGGLVRSLGGIIQNRNAPVLTDERILGTGDFVKKLLVKEGKYLSSEERYEKMISLIEYHCEKTGTTPDALRGGIKAGKIPALRSQLACILANNMGIPYAEIGRQLGITTSAVSKIMRRNENKSR